MYRITRPKQRLRFDAELARVSYTTDLASSWLPDPLLAIAAARSTSPPTALDLCCFLAYSRRDTGSSGGQGSLDCATLTSFGSTVIYCTIYDRCACGAVCTTLPPSLTAVSRTKARKQRRSRTVSGRSLGETISTQGSRPRPPCLLSLRTPIQAGSRPAFGLSKRRTKRPVLR